MLSQRFFVLFFSRFFLFYFFDFEKNNKRSHYRTALSNNIVYSWFSFFPMLLFFRCKHRYNRDRKLTHDAAVALLSDLMKVYGIKYDKNAVKNWLSKNGLPPGGNGVDRQKFSSLFLAKAQQNNLIMSDILTLEAEVSKGALYFAIPLEVSNDRAAERSEEHVTSRLISSLRKRAMDEEGLFRLAGNKQEVRRLRLMIDAGRDVNFDACPVHDVSSLLKIFYRELPEPIIPFEKYDSVVGAARDTDDNDTEGLVAKLMALVESLPPVNVLHLHRLFAFMNEVAANADVNKMSLRNLVIVMAPNLLRARETTVEKTMADYNHVNVAIQTLVSRNMDIFASHHDDSGGISGYSASGARAPSTSSSSLAPLPGAVVDHINNESYYEENDSGGQPAIETAPPPAVAPVIQQATVLWDFDGMQGSGLIVRSGDIVEVVSEDQGEWVYCRMGDMEGYIPSAYIEKSS
jgi:RhoGAP domain/SH3 domain